MEIYIDGTWYVQTYTKRSAEIQAKKTWQRAVYDAGLTLVCFEKKKKAREINYTATQGDLAELHMRRVANPGRKEDKDKLEYRLDQMDGLTNIKWWIRRYILVAS